MNNTLPNLTVLAVDSLQLSKVAENTLDFEQLDLSNFRFLSNFSFNAFSRLKTLSFSRDPFTNLLFANNHFAAAEELNVQSAKIFNMDSTSAPNLLRLNASDNVLVGKVDNLDAPKLQSLDLSHNILSEFKDAAYPDLQTLDLSSNLILSTFENNSLPELRNLHLQNNLLGEFAINSDKLEVLDITNNKILEFSGNSLNNLVWLGVSDNLIEKF